MNRRSFLKSAAGLFVASAALAVPERRVFALDQTMIPQPSGASPHVNVGAGQVVINGQPYPISGPHDDELREAMRRNKLALEQSILEGRDIYPRGFDLMPYEVIKIDSEIMWITGDWGVVRGTGGTKEAFHDPSSPIYILGPIAPGYEPV